MSQTMATEAPQTYRPFARLLHWTLALLILATLPAGAIMVQDGLARSTQDALFIFHKNVGVLILLLMVVRLGYRLASPPPPPPASVPDVQKRIAEATHWALYALVFAMALSGYVRVIAGGFPIETLNWLGVPPLVPRSDPLAETAKAIHFWARFALVALVLAHVGAALHHLVIKRDGVFSRMWPTRRR